MTDELTPRLKKLATEWAKKTTRLANQFLGGKKKLIKVESKSKIAPGLVEITTTATPFAFDEDGRLKDVARAYEYGSGVHSRRSRKSPKQVSPKGKIVIKPKGGKFLAFNWEVANANPEKFYFHEDGRVLLPQVKHPGVKSVNNEKGYLAPAATEVRKDMRRELPKEVRGAVLASVRKGFKKGR
jgi:hypothetical protein